MSEAPFSTPTTYFSSALRGRRGAAGGAPAAAAFTITEMVVIGLIVIVLVGFLAPSVKRSHEAAVAARQGGITVTLRRIESAKAQCAADRHMKLGEMLTLEDLVRGGYLKRGDLFRSHGNDSTAPGVKYHVGAVGTPVSYFFDEDYAESQK